jgi:hypothetical protein
MTYLSELVCDLLYLRDVLFRSDPDSPQWYSLCDADPQFRHVMNEPTTVIYVFDI